MQAEELTKFVLDKIDDMKGRDVLVLDVKGLSTITDTMIIASGNSKRHVQSIAENVATEAKHAGMKPLGVEGQSEGEWVLVDLGELVLHVMQEKARDFYQLEKLWGRNGE
ncbi:MULTISPECIES: ribosome silencing factor [Corallincola]|uniref:Ribosomal silencing factor RsfS n=2 Tax=Corallincola TaxID=1775176 RepID=A0ABY1WN35_9GAMM|nr:MULTISPECIES: ribosome silencing factor [Corallincola]TAA43712.1 ribosome silencing factor [Corallincola spongiicola]TCI02959.1 ribosome silencing factor [Corallincola luteus]